MATIELDIIKQRSEKLLPKEKIELINHIAASLSPKDNGKIKKLSEIAESIPAKNNKVTEKKTS